MTQSTAGVLTQSTTPKSKTLTVAAHIGRVLLGIIFLVFGLNKFFQFITMPPPAGVAGEFMFGLSKAPYMFPLLAIVEVLAGVLLLLGRLVPFALLILFPIILNIFFFHLTLAPQSMGMAVILLLANILLAAYYWPAYKLLFAAGNAWDNKRA